MSSIFSPKDLKEMGDRLEREALPGETRVDREIRATAILREKQMEQNREAPVPADADRQPSLGSGKHPY